MSEETLFYCGIHDCKSLSFSFSVIGILNINIATLQN